MTQTEVASLNFFYLDQCRNYRFGLVSGQQCAFTKDLAACQVIAEFGAQAVEQYLILSGVLKQLIVYVTS